MTPDSSGTQMDNDESNPRVSPGEEIGRSSKA